MPSQNPRKPFPAWRLINGVKNASDGDLEASSESCEYWSWFFGGLVVFGIAAEVVIGICHPAYDSVWGKWGSTLANALVVLGVAGEIQFSRMGFRRDQELKRRSDKVVAEANARAAMAEQRAADANLELARMKAPRSLSAEQQGRMVVKLAAYTDTPFNIGTILNDTEVFRFEAQLETVLASANRQQINWIGGDVVLNRPGKPVIGLISATDLTAGAYREKAETLGRAAVALADALNEEGIAAKAEIVGDAFINKNRDVVHIVIGRKT